MHLGLRLAYLIAAVVLLLMLPAGEDSVLLVLFVAIDLGAAALLLRPDAARPGRVVALRGNGARFADDASLVLMRRTVPALRSRRPAVAIEAQVRWRAAADARRQFRAVY